jgi:plastocyanin
VRAIRRATVLTAALFVMLGLVPAPASAGGGGAYCEPLKQRPPALTVWVRDNCFTAKTVKITAGQAVTWAPRNAVAAHTVTSSGLFDSSDLEGLFTVRFNEPGTYPYVCTYHSWEGAGMVGKVVVSGPAVENADEPVTQLDGVTEESTDARLAAAEERLAKAIAALRVSSPETVELAGGRVDESRLAPKPVSEIVAWAMLALVVGLLLGRRGARRDPGDIG